MTELLPKWHEWHCSHCYYHTSGYYKVKRVGNGKIRCWKCENVIGSTSYAYALDYRPWSVWLSFLPFYLIKIVLEYSFERIKAISISVFGSTKAWRKVSEEVSKDLKKTKKKYLTQKKTSGSKRIDTLIEALRRKEGAISIANSDKSGALTVSTLDTSPEKAAASRYLISDPRFSI